MNFGLKGRRFIGFLVLLSFLAIITISRFKVSLELEDAEQAYYTQSWRLGYDDQPPLYTWVQKAANTIFGLSKFSLSFLRGVLYAATLAGLYFLAKKILNNDRKAQLVVLSTALVPVFADFALRRLSHTLLLCFAVVLSCLALARLKERKSIWNYVFLGICLGIGMLSKYNYVLLVAAMSIAVWFSKDLREIVLDIKIFISVIIGLLLFLPHLYWIFSSDYLHWIRESVSSKMDGKTSGSIILRPIWNTSLAFVQTASLLVLATLLLWWTKRIKWKVHGGAKWFLKLFVVQIMTLLVFFIVVDAGSVQTRWLLPLFLPYLILWIGCLSEDNGRLRQWGVFIFVLFVVFQVIRTPTEILMGIKSDNQFDYAPLSTMLREKYPEEVWVLPDVTYGGQIRLLNKERTIYTLDDFSIAANVKGSQKGVVLAKTKDCCDTIRPIDSLMQYGPEKDDVFLFEVDDVAQMSCWPHLF
ncbi:MAG: glycosyltransferase family 39 protein [Flavobacteriaceae bacterium]|nr:glycosyltransferase family 39 protein [Flavobacteriaceae bacterium]